MAPLRLLGAAACVLAVLVTGSCGGGGKDVSQAPALKRFPRPLFDGLWLGMTRADAAAAHPIRPALTASGRNRLVWIYDRPGEYTVELTFEENRTDAPLERIDVHFGKNREASERTVAILSRSLGDPDVRRQKAATNAYGDHLHDQYDTVWSDAAQYVFPHRRLCTDAEGCAIIRDGRPLYSDHSHLSRFGAESLSSLFDPLFTSIAEASPGVRPPLARGGHRPE